MSTPTHGAHGPSRSTGLSISSCWSTPISEAAATMPKARRPSCTMPVTSRLAPAIICPAASSTVAMVSTPPGRKVASGGMRMRTGLSPRSVWWVDREDRRSPRRRRPRSGRSGRGWRGAGSLSRPTRSPRAKAAAIPPRVGWSSRARPAVRIPWPSTRMAAAERRLHDADPRQLQQAVGRGDGGLLGLVDEVVERGDLVEPVVDPLLVGAQQHPGGGRLAALDEHAGRQHEELEAAVAP